MVARTDKSIHGQAEVDLQFAEDGSCVTGQDEAWVVRYKGAVAQVQGTRFALLRCARPQRALHAI